MRRANDVGGIPLVVVSGQPAYGAYAAADGLCPRCGAVPSHLVEITFPPLSGEVDAESEGGKK